MARPTLATLALCFFLGFSSRPVAAADKARPVDPQWVWAETTSSGQTVWFRKTVDLKAPIKSAKLYATCDNQIRIYVNGELAGQSKAWESPVQKDVASLLKVGRNTIAVEGTNEGGVAAMTFKLTVNSQGAPVQEFVTDESWLQTANPVEGWTESGLNTSNWKPVRTLGPFGKAPWGKPGLKTAQVAKAIKPGDVTVPDGFQVDVVHQVEPEQGSWVALATDPKGRIYACDQGRAGLFRVTMRPKQPPIVEKVSVGPLADLSGAQGMSWAFDSLWFHRNGGNLLRLSDSDGDDRLDSIETFPGTTGGGEHGNHAVIPTEDGSGLYLDGGNSSPLADHKISRVPTWYEGLLLPRMWDAKGHARGRMAPGGWITRVDPETGQQTVHSVGYRNQYDIALNRMGDLFTYDADMEWDLGLPWYRPTRICFASSGSDYGWRSGAGKWPTYYEDSLPPVVEIGPGSPTGLLSGIGTKFPTRYQDAIFALDWTFGTMYTIELSPVGAGYQGTAKPFLFGSPLPLTDAVVGADGAIYFAVGGRGTQSALLRVRYVGDESTDQPTDASESTSLARSHRRSLERFHGVVEPEAIDLAWPVLSNPDRFLRHAARVAIESQPVSSWADRVAVEPNPQARITASVALARMGKPEHLDLVLGGLLDLQPGELDDGQRLGMLRGYALAMTQLGSPSQPQRQRIIDQLEPLLPANDPNVNTELIRVLVSLRAQSVVPKTIALIQGRQSPELPPWSELASRNRRYGSAIEQMLRSHPPTRQLGYAFMLRHMKTGWTIDDRRAYFSFLNDAADASGGASYAGYLTRIRDEALANCSAEERIALEDITGEDFNPKPDFPIIQPVGPGQPWTLAAAMSTERGKKDFERGRSLYFSAKCAACHRLAGLGGDIGPDLTSARNKFDRQYVVEAIVHPSKHISDQYGSSQVLTEDGQVLIGLVVEREDGGITLYPIDENGKAVELEADDILRIEESKVSQMPEGLLDRLNAQEVRDLVAYIMSGGDPKDKLYGSSR